MGMVAPEQRLASAFVVIHGKHGEVRRYAQERGVCRQSIDNDAAALRNALASAPHANAGLCEQRRQAPPQRAELHARLAQAVVIDAPKQAAVACVGQARGVTLRDGRELWAVLLPGQALRGAALGRRTHAAAKKAGALLTVFDAAARPKVREAAADESYVKDPGLMVVEPESLCWTSGRLSDTVSGAAWAQEFTQLPNLEPLMRDGGTGLEQGVALVNEQRHAEGKRLLTDPGDHVHALRHGGVGMHKAQRPACQALAQAEAAQQELDECARQGPSRAGIATRVRHAWQKAAEALDTWQTRERLWPKTQPTWPLVTPDGVLNTRQQAELVLAETLPPLPDSDFAKAKHQRQKPALLNYLDRVQEQMAAWPCAEAVQQAAVRQEAWRRRPEALPAETPTAAALRGVRLLGAVVLSKADAGMQAAAAVTDIFRRAYRASSLVECLNSVLRMHPAGHRRMTPGLVDRKRLYWNGHTFTAGRRRKTTPYERLGVPWPPGLPWGDVLKVTPEQLRDKLSTATMVV